MIKRCLFFLLSALPSVIYCQEIKSNEVDPFTSERTIETTLVPLKQGFSAGYGITYYAVNANYYLNLLGYGNDETSIKNDDKLWFVLDDGSVVQFNDRAEVESNSTTDKNVYIHHYFAKMSDIEILKNKHVAIIRIASADGKLKDLKLSKKIRKAVMKLNEIFFKEVNK